MKLNRVAQVLLAILILAIFVSSYFTLTNIKNSVTPPTTPTKNTTQPATVLGLAYANAMIEGYNGTVNISVACHNETTPVLNKIDSIVSALEQNNSIYNSYTLQNYILIQTGNMNAYSLYSYINMNLNSTSKKCMNFSTDALVALPNQLTTHVGTQTYTIPVPPSLELYPVPVVLENQTANSIKLKILMLLLQNGTIYQLNATRTNFNFTNETSTTSHLNQTSINHTSNQSTNKTATKSNSNTLAINSTSSNTLASNSMASNSITKPEQPGSNTINKST